MSPGAKQDEQLFNIQGGDIRPFNGACPKYVLQAHVEHTGIVALNLARG